MFKFGENWASFSRQLNETHIEDAERSLLSLFGKNGLAGRSFLDIGCGSGLFAIAAARLGCAPVRGIDIDPVSIQVSRENAGLWLNVPADLEFQQASVLNVEQMNSFGKFDIVYSWGVLHHTGSMGVAIRNAARLVKPDGQFMIAIYNRHWSSGAWWVVKWIYSRMGAVGQKALLWIFAPIIYIAKFIATVEDPFIMRRGMDFWHNVVDWVGGFPYEYASVGEMMGFLNEIGFEIGMVRGTNTPIGCNEFLCEHKKNV